MVTVAGFVFFGQHSIYYASIKIILEGPRMGKDIIFLIVHIKVFIRIICLRRTIVEKFAGIVTHK